MLTRDYIRQRARVRLPLTESAAAILDKIKAEDPDLGGGDSFGEILPPDDVRKQKGPLDTEDENELELSTISPMMRKAIGETDPEEEENQDDS
jgi:hypothetical protein